MTTRGFRGIYTIKPWWQKQLHELADALASHSIHPDLVTLSGVVCAGLLGSLLALTERWPLLALGVAPLAIGRLAANALDGLVARQTGLARPWGELVNEGSDRLSDALIFIGLALNSRVLPLLAWGVLILILLSSYLGLAGKAAGGKRQYGGFLAKADRMIYLALFSPLVLLCGASAWNWLLVAFIPAIALTIGQRLNWSYNDLKTPPGEV